MLYLLDASLLITANNTYYPVDSVADIGTGFSIMRSKAT